MKVGTCKDCIQSGPGCAWCKKLVGPCSLSSCSPPQQSANRHQESHPACLALPDLMVGVLYVLPGGWGQEGSSSHDLSPSIPIKGFLFSINALETWFGGQVIL